MSEAPIISIDSVGMSYNLYPSSRAMMLNMLGFYRLFRPGVQFQQFPALKDISLSIRRGERVGLIGRNGSGKTTLLKLITGNFYPTSGNIVVKGEIQSLMDSGLGFHPEFTGLENIKSSLTYNGLSKKDLEIATEDIIEFVELGDFLAQPIKTYSLGMLARLAFATATAVKPEILIVDEVLSAGDAYFTAKSADRMKTLTKSGVTLLLVSHSNQQVLQYCERVIWLNQGHIVQDGRALDVLKAYEAFIRRLDNDRLIANNRKKIAKSRGEEVESVKEKPSKIIPETTSSEFEWKEESGLRVEDVRIRDSEGQFVGVLATNRPFQIEIDVCAEGAGTFPCVYHVYFYSGDGAKVSAHLSETETVVYKSGEVKTARLCFDRSHFGPGEFILTVGLYKSIDPTNTSSRKIYEILDRCVQIKVVSQFSELDSLIYHPCHWVGCKELPLKDISELA